MSYVSALLPPLVMAVAFTFLVVTIIRNQGGANRAKEDAAVDAVLGRVEPVRQDAAGAGRPDGS